MVRILLFIMLLSIGNMVAAQDPDLRKPEFRGGIKAFQDFLWEQKIYPLEARHKKVEGVVYLSFIIDEKGKAGEVVIHKSESKYFDTAIYKAFDRMPGWLPAQREEKAVKSKVYMTFTYSIGHKKIAYDEDFFNKIIKEDTLASFDLGKFDWMGHPTDFKLPKPMEPVREKFYENYENALKAIENKEYRKAIKLLNQVYRGDPGNPDILYNRGYAKYQSGNKKGACKDWNAAWKNGSYEAADKILEFCTEFPEGID